MDSQNKVSSPALEMTENGTSTVGVFPGPIGRTPMPSAGSGDSSVSPGATPESPDCSKSVCLRTFIHGLLFGLAFLGFVLVLLITVFFWLSLRRCCKQCRPNPSQRRTSMDSLNIRSAPQQGWLAGLASKFSTVAPKMPNMHLSDMGSSQTANQEVAQVTHLKTILFIIT